MPNHGTAARLPTPMTAATIPTREYQGGVGSPFSNRASNIDGSGQLTSEIAPRLPSPEAGGDDAHGAADGGRPGALARNQTGAAQEALERAETRVLTRSTEPALANQSRHAGDGPRPSAEARMALGKRDTATGARRSSSTCPQPPLMRRSRAARRNLASQPAASSRLIYRAAAFPQQLSGRLHSGPPRYSFLRRASHGHP